MIAKNIFQLPGAFILLSSLLGCASPQVVTKTVPVEVERVTYKSLPSDILSMCQNRPAQLRNAITNAELRQVALQWQNVYGSCLESKLESIRKLQPK